MQLYDELSISNFSLISIRFWCFFFIILIIPYSAFSNDRLSDKSQLTILTCAPGNELYSAFGHTAIRVFDPVNIRDEVYNFGTFDFRTPNFYTKFLTGRLDYALDVSDFEDFIAEYKSEGRTVYEQQILIPQELQQKMYDTLQVLMLTKNRFYKYDFFRNNCSTKVIDLLLYFSDKQQIKDTLMKPSGKTFRKALKPYIASNAWLSLGINLLLGPFADQQMSLLQSSYLPENLMEAAKRSGIAEPPKYIFMGAPPLPGKNESELPIILFWLLLIVLAIESFWLKATTSISDWIDVALFTISGLLGVLLVFLWKWSDHVSFHVNLNLLWANPFNLFLIWGILAKRKKFTRIYLLIFSLLMFFLLINWTKMPQSFPMAIMPIVTILAFRSVSRVFNFKKIGNQ